MKPTGLIALSKVTLRVPCDAVGVGEGVGKGAADVVALGAGLGVLLVCGVGSKAEGLGAGVALTRLVGTIPVCSGVRSADVQPVRMLKMKGTVLFMPKL